jgi:transcriptional regulator with XRE-family HTH domain
MTERRRSEELERCTNRSIPLPRLRVHRQSRGLTQKELASRAGISAGTVHRLESLKRGSYPRTLRKLARALGVTPEQLVRDHRPE